MRSPGTGIKGSMPKLSISGSCWVTAFGFSELFSEGQGVRIAAVTMRQVRQSAAVARTRARGGERGFSHSKRTYKVQFSSVQFALHLSHARPLSL